MQGDRRVIVAAGLLILLSIVFLSCPQPITETVLLVADDQIAPVIEILSPANNSAMVSTITIDGMLADSSQSAGDNAGSLSRLVFTVLDAGSLTRTVKFDASNLVASTDPAGDAFFTWDPTSGAFSLTFTTIGLDGNQFITLTATDRNENVGTAEFTLRDNGEGPVIEIISPANNSTYASLVTVTGTVRDYDSTADAPEVDEVSTFQWRSALLSQGGNISFGADGAFSFTVNTLNSEYPTLSIEITAVDMNGRDRTETLTIVNDGKAPVIQWGPGLNGSIYSTDVTIFGWLADTNLLTTIDEILFNEGDNPPETATPKLTIADRTYVLTRDNDTDEIDDKGTATTDDDEVLFERVALSMNEGKPGYFTADYSIDVATWPGGTMLVTLDTKDTTGNAVTSSIQLFESNNGPPVTVEFPDSLTVYYWDGNPIDMTVEGIVGDTSQLFLFIWYFFDTSRSGSVTVGAADGDDNAPFEFSLPLRVYSTDVGGELDVNGDPWIDPSLFDQTQKTLVLEATNLLSKVTKTFRQFDIDSTEPTFVPGSSSISSDNATATIALSEGVWTDAYKNGAITSADFNFALVSTVADADGVTPDPSYGYVAPTVVFNGIHQTDTVFGDPDTDLTGGESEFLLNLTVTGTPDHDDVITITPKTAAVGGTSSAGNAAVYDRGTRYLALSPLSLELHDQTPPYLLSSSKATSSVATVTDAQDGAGSSDFTVNVNFYEPMGSATPDIAIEPAASVAGILTRSGGSWLDTDTFQAVYSLTDTDAVVSDLDVTVVNMADLAGNIQSTMETVSDLFSIDTDNPEVSGVTAWAVSGGVRGAQYVTGSPATLKIGDVVDLVVAFDQVVNVTGTPQLTLNTLAVVDYDSTADVNDNDAYMAFRYTVDVADSDVTDLEYGAYASALALNSGRTIRDVNGNNAYTSLPNPATTVGISLGESSDVTVNAVGILSASTADDDNDGYLDKMYIVLNRTIDDSTIATAENACFTIGDGTVYTATTASAGAGTDDETIEVTFTNGASNYDTGETPTIVLLPGGVTSTAGGFIAQGNSVVSDDEAKAVLVWAQYVDAQTPGVFNKTGDKLVLTFSETIGSWDDGDGAGVTYTSENLFECYLVFSGGAGITDGTNPGTNIAPSLDETAIPESPTDQTLSLVQDTDDNAVTGFEVGVTTLSLSASSLIGDMSIQDTAGNEVNTSSTIAVTIIAEIYTPNPSVYGEPQTGAGIGTLGGSLFDDDSENRTSVGSGIVSGWNRKGRDTGTLPVGEDSLVFAGVPIGHSRSGQSGTERMSGSTPPGTVTFNGSPRALSPGIPTTPSVVTNSRIVSRSAVRSPQTSDSETAATTVEPAAGLPAETAAVRAGAIPEGIPGTDTAETVDQDSSSRRTIVIGLFMAIVGLLVLGVVFRTRTRA